jgi:hypothetical protein
MFAECRGREAVALTKHRHDFGVREQRMRKGRPLDHAVAVPASDPSDRYVAAFDEVAQDRRRRALSDPDENRDVTHTDVRLAGDAEQDVHVVGEETPAAHVLIIIGITIPEL